MNATRTFANQEVSVSMFNLLAMQQRLRIARSHASSIAETQRELGSISNLVNEAICNRNKEQAAFDAMQEALEEIVRLFPQTAMREAADSRIVWDAIAQAKAALALASGEPRRG